MKVDCPWSGSEFDLLTGEWLHIAEPVPFVKKKAGQSQGAKTQQSAYSELMKAINALEAAAQTAHSLSNAELKRLTKDVQKLVSEIRS